MPTGSVLPRTSPETQGISSEAIEDFIATADKTIHSLHSLMLLRNGKVVAEGWWYPWRAESAHMMFSLSKSFTSTAVGLAIAEARLGEDDQVLSFFTDKAPRKISKYLAEMKVRHLLTMTTGHDRDTFEEILASHTPVKTFLSVPVEYPPGAHFLYDTGASFMLSAILQKLTGLTLVEYLTPRLFEPLGISGATWDSHPVGINYGGMGLNIKTEDIARFGQLYLQHGEWYGQQILPGWWVEAAIARQVSNGDDPNSDWTQGYGFQFWQCRHNAFRGDGAFGQFCVVIPEKEVVVAITAGVADMQVVLDLVWEKLLPAMRDDPSLDGHIDEKTSEPMHVNMRLAAPTGDRSSVVAQTVSGRVYHFEPNYESLHTVSFRFDVGICTMTYRLLGGGRRRGTYRMNIGNGEWVEGTTFLGGLAPQKVALSGSWTAQDTFTVTMCYYETPFILTLTCRFEGDKLFYVCKSNVAFGPLNYPQLVGFTVNGN